MPYELDDLEFESVALSEERGRDFDEWVARRLSEWPLADIRAFDEWLLAEAHFEFIPAVRLVLEDRQRRPELVERADDDVREPERVLGGRERAVWQGDDPHAGRRRCA
jgi:hypothetical protein